MIYNHIKKYIEPTDVVIEVGCGDGYGVAILSSVAKKVVGIDKNKKIIQKAMLTNKKPNNYFLCNNVDQLPIFPISDVVVAIGVIDKLRFPESFIGKIIMSTRKMIISDCIIDDGLWKLIEEITSDNNKLMIYHKI